MKALGRFARGSGNSVNAYLSQDIATSTVWVDKGKLEFSRRPAGLAFDLLHEVCQFPQGRIRPCVYLDPMGVDLNTALSRCRNVLCLEGSCVSKKIQNDGLK